MMCIGCQQLGQVSNGRRAKAEWFFGRRHGIALLGCRRGRVSQPSVPDGSVGLFPADNRKVSSALRCGARLLPNNEPLKHVGKVKGLA